MPLARQTDIATYDVIVDDAPSAPNQKERSWAILQGFLPMLMQMRFPPQIWMEVLRISPLPASFTDKVIALMQQPEHAGPTAAPPPEIQAQLQQIQLMQQAAAVDAAIKQQKAQQDMALKAAKLQGELALKAVAQARAGATAQ